MADKAKKPLITKEQLITDGINAGMVTGGVMLGNMMTKLIPVQNKLVSALIPTGGGVGLLLINNPKISRFSKPLGYGLLAYGVLAMARAALVGDSVTTEGQNGIAGIGNSETVQKVVNLLIPNLGDAEPMNRSSYSDQVFDLDEPREIEDQDAEVLEGADELDALNGAGDEAFESLAGDYDLYANDLYM